MATVEDVTLYDRLYEDLVSLYSRLSFLKDGYINDWAGAPTGPPVPIDLSEKELHLIRFALNGCLFDIGNFRVNPLHNKYDTQAQKFKEVYKVDPSTSPAGPEVQTGNVPGPQ